MTWAPKNKGGEERRADSGAEEALGCLNGDAKGTENAHHPHLSVFPAGMQAGGAHAGCLLEELFWRHSLTYPCTCLPPHPRPPHL